MRLYKPVGRNVVLMVEDAGKFVLNGQPIHPDDAAQLIKAGLMIESTITRKKTACKKKPHYFIPITRKLEIYPYELERFQQCVRCGRKKKGVIL